jgi:hypothetical protein
VLFSLHFARNLLNLLEFLAEANSSKFNSFLQSEVKITHIIVQNNTYLILPTIRCTFNYKKIASKIQACLKLI